MAFAAQIATRPARGATAEAYIGEPYGVGRVTFGIDAGSGVFDSNDPRLAVADDAGRVLYPVAGDAPVRRILRRLMEIETPASVTISFLFQGDAPLDLVTYGPRAQRVRVTPVRNPNGRSRALNDWWKAYSTRWQQLDQDPQFPPVVDNFLIASLSRRLGQPLPEPKKRLLSLGSSGPTAVDELLASERHLLAIDRELLSALPAEGDPKAPLPAPMPWYELDPPAETDGIAVEPLSLHAPAECFYIRFGTFSNYLWFRDLSELWQNDLGNMIMRRSIHRHASERIEQQLAIHQTAMSKILGPQVIADVAIVGLDPYLSQGAAIGMLFQAKNNFLLNRDLMSKRREALAQFPGATETEVELAGGKVNVIATPDGQVRSYYAQDGDFHLVTTSRRLAQRFLEAGQGIGALAATPGFLSVRRRIPFDADAALFAYAAPEMFRELTSPGNWIERRRRLRSLREAKLIELARLQAAAEGSPATTREELIAADYLPAGFGARYDGSELAVDPVSHQAVDSLRGAAGFFVPIADMEVEGAKAASEAAAYRSFADRFQQQCGQFPPIGLCVKRIPRGEAGDETLAIEALASPLDRIKLGKLPDALGEPSSQRIAWLPGDLVNLEVVVDAILPLGAGAAEQHQLFLGVRDFSAELELARGKLGLPVPEQRDAMKVYWGSWPKAGLLGLLGNLAAAGAEPQPDNRGGFVARRDDVFLGSFSPTLVRDVLPQLVVEDVAEPAQAWLRVEQLAGTQLEPLVNKLGYSRVLATANANSRLLGALGSQLHVPPEECLTVANRLMDGELACPLGGTYQLVAADNQQSHWSSTVVAPANQFFLTEPPADFQLPIVGWFGGATASGLVAKDAIVVKADVAVDASALPKGMVWPKPEPAPAVEALPVPPPASN